MKIIVLDSLPLNPGDVSWGPLASLGLLATREWTDPKDVPMAVEGFDVVLVNKVKLGRADLPALKSCRLVGALATGTNNLDLAALREAGISVCNVPGYGVADVAQHALALLLEICNNVGFEARAVREGKWGRKNVWCYWHEAPLSLAGKTLGIIGFGAIGRAFGGLGHALGMSVLASSRSRKNAPAYEPFAWASWSDIFARADALSLHCPLTPETERLVNAKSIAQMRPGTIIINTARGDLVDDAALAEALETGRLGGYGADVLSSEPPDPANPLLKAPNTFITPHMAWASKEARQRIIDIMAENIKSWQAGNLQNRVA